MFQFDATENLAIRVSMLKSKKFPTLTNDTTAIESEPPFKKGTKKYKLYKALSKAQNHDGVSKFHEKRFVNLAISHVGKTKCEEFTNKLSSEDIHRLSVKKSRNYILIGCSGGVYRRIKISSYMKLIKLRKVIIESRCVSRTDCGDYETVYKDRIIVDSINRLLKILTEERIRCDCIYELQLKSRGYDMYDFKYKIMTLDKSGEYKFYGDINDFCKEFVLEMI